MNHTREVTIDSAGRLVVPKEMRDALGLTPGSSLRITIRNEHLELEPMPRAVRLERKGALTVAVAFEPSAPLRAREVEETRHALRLPSDAL